MMYKKAINNVESPVWISTIIPTRNRASLLKRVIDSLLQDDYPYKEIIIIDGASADGTVDLLHSYGDKIKWVSEFENGEHHVDGEFNARNKALRLAIGDIIRYLSDDDEHMPGGMAYAASYFIENPDTDILFGQSKIFYQKINGEVIMIDDRKRFSESVKLMNFIRNVLPYPPSETAFFRRRVIEKIGWFETNMRGADHEYWARAANAGLKLDVGDKVVLHCYKSEINEIQYANNYSKLIFSRWVLAKHYGSLNDRIYVACYLIPRLFILDRVKRFLPRRFSFFLRRLRWHQINKTSL